MATVSVTSATSATTLADGSSDVILTNQGADIVLVIHPTLGGQIGYEPLVPGQIMALTPNGTAVTAKLRPGTSTAMNVDVASGIVKGHAGAVTNAAGNKLTTVAQIAADSGMTGTYVRLVNPVTFVGLGDSITANGGRVVNNAAQPAYAVTNISWHTWGQLLSDSRAIYSGCYGAVSQTIQQIKNTYLPYLLAQPIKPTYCVVLAGANNLPTLSNQDLSDYTAMVNQILGAGITPILCTCTPQINTVNIHKINAHIRNLALVLGLPLVDLYATVIDPTTGTWQSTWTSDGTHPTALGAKNMGQALATVLTNLIPVNSNLAWLPSTDQGLTNARGTNVGGNTNTLLKNNNAAGAPYFTASDWSVLSPGSGANVCALAAPGAPVVGNRMTVTTTAVASAIVRGTLVNATALQGDQILVACRLSATVKGVSGSWGMSLLDAASGLYYDLGRNQSQQTEDLAPHVWMTVVTASSPAQFATLRMDIQASTTGAVVAIDQVAAVNLTGLGVNISVPTTFTS